MSRLCTRARLTVSAFLFSLLAVAALAGPAAAAPAAGALTLDAGAGHTCAVRTSGQVVCWGENSRGQLGNAPAPTEVDTTDQRTPVAATGVVAESVSAGFQHSCAVRANGTAVCWGLDEDGQLGNGGPPRQSAASGPVDVQGLSDASAISVGSRHSCALRATGQVACWGDSNSGRLGNGVTSGDPQTTPATITGLTAVGVSVGAAHSCAVRNDGTVACWGSDADGQLGNGAGGETGAPTTVGGVTGVVAVAAADRSTCALHRVGTVTCWGSLVPQEAPILPTAVANLSDAVFIGGGTDHRCAVRKGGSVVCWGEGQLGQLGNGQIGASALSATPVATGVTGAVAVSDGGTHSCAARADNTIRCWGNNASGQTGSGLPSLSPTPVGVSGLTAVTKLASSGSHNCAVRPTATLCWGDNTFGQLGNGSTDPSLAPTPVSGLTDAIEIAAGFGHSCAVRAGGTVACWGSDQVGQVGDGDSGSGEELVRVPRAVSGLAGVRAVAAGSGHSCALRTSGSVACWGLDGFGQLGNGGAEQISPTPVEVTGLPDATAIALGYSHSCALRTDRQVACWGDNFAGQLGVDPEATAARTTPGVVPGLDNVTAISAGDDHTCARRTDATVACWGSGLAGQLGQGSADSSFAPVQVAGLAGATAIATGSTHSCAARTGGSVSCWGENAVGQGGQPVTQNELLAPSVVAGLTGATSVAAGTGHSCALRGDGTVACWGDGIGGQLGDGPMPGGHAPLQSSPASVSNLADAQLPTAFAVVDPEPSNPDPNPENPGPGPAPTPDPGPGVITPDPNPPGLDPVAPEPKISAKLKIKKSAVSKGLRFRVLEGKPGSKYAGVLKIGNRGGKANGTLDAKGQALITLKLPKAMLKKVKKGTKLALRINVVKQDGKIVKLVRTITVT